MAKQINERKIKQKNPSEKFCQIIANSFISSAQYSNMQKMKTPAYFHNYCSMINCATGQMCCTIPYK